MRILGICGSPRKGNTEQMIEWVLESCRSGSAVCSMVKLKDLKITPCNGCDSCYGGSVPCVIEDDMEEAISKMIEADAIVFGSPNYFSNLSGIMKNFIDRNNAICDPPLLKSKIAAFVCVGARDKGETVFVEEIFRKYCSAMKMFYVGSVIAQAEDPSEVKSKEDVKLACTDLGNRIINSRC